MIKRFIFIILGIFLIATPTFANNLLVDLESYYALEETTGSTFADSSVNGLDATTQTGSPTLAQTGINGNAISFTDDRIGYNYGAYGSGGEDIINATNSVLSFSYWVKPTSSSQSGCNVVIGQNHGSGGSKIAMGQCQGGTTADNNGNNVIGLTEATAWLATTSTYNTNNWNHVVMTWNYNTGNFKQYLNGALIKTDSSSLYSTSSTDDVLFQIGGYLPSRMIDSAVIDEVALWRKELTSTDVSNLYNSGSGLFYSSFTAPTGLYANLDVYFDMESETDLVSGYDLTATLSSGTSASFTTGKVGTYSLDVDGTSSKPSVRTNYDGLCSLVGDYTINFWLNRNSGTAKAGLVANWDGGTSNQVMFSDTSSNDIRFGRKDSSGNIVFTESTSNQFASNNWQMVTLTYDSTGQLVTAYINGTSISSDSTATQTATQAGCSSPNFMVIGSGVYGTWTNNFLDGQIDEVGVWHTLLNSTEISCLYNSGSGLEYSDFGTCGTTPNTNPNITAIADQSMNEDTTLNVTSAFTIADAEDPVNSLTLSYSGYNTSLLNTTSISFDVNTTTGVVDMSITPLPNAYGVTNVTISVNDTLNATNSSTFLLTIFNVNDAPTITNISSPQIVTESNTLVINFNVTDIDNPYTDLIYSAVAGDTSLISSATFSNYNGTNQTLTIVAPADFGKTDINVSVRDLQPAIASTTFDYIVNCNTTTRYYSPMNVTEQEFVGSTTPTTCFDQTFTYNTITDILTYTWHDFGQTMNNIKFWAYDTTGNFRIPLNETTLTGNNGTLTIDYSAVNPNYNILAIADLTDNTRSFYTGSGVSSTARILDVNVDQAGQLGSLFSVSDGIVYGVLILLLFLTLGIASQSASLTLIFSILGLFIASKFVLRIPSQFIWITGALVVILLYLIAKLRTD